MRTPLRWALAGALAVGLGVSTSAQFSPQTAQAATVTAAGIATGPMAPFKHLVVIYEENHSFDNLYGNWGPVGGDQVNGTKQVKQVTQNGKTYSCLLQNDVNLSSPTPLATTCTDTTTGTSFPSHFRNGTFTIDKYIPSTATTCPQPGVYAPHGVVNGKGLPGGCTEDLVHRFYQEQYQINGGKQNRYATGSDAAGLTMGTYDTKQLPIYKYLHSKTAPNYVLADNFFQAAYGGSFLNHQYLIAARAPLDTSAGALGAKNSVLDAQGMPVASYPLYKSASKGLVDGQLTVKCADGSNNWAAACGNFAVNTVQPSSAPASSSGAKIPLINDAKYPNIGDRMSAAGVSWNWYSGGWDNAVAGKPGRNFQFHHQPFNYFAAYAPGTTGRKHLQDETKFIAAAKAGTLPQVSFVKPYGDENEHPGYSSEPNGSDHLVSLLKTINASPQAKDTLVVVTYDEFGGQFDHVSPTPRDKWGDGTRIPALFISKRFTQSGVDHTNYDTVSIMSTIEHQFGLAPVATRDAQVNDLRRGVQRGFAKASKNTFAVIGDLPYGDAQVAALPSWIKEINSSGVAMTFHVGDIKNGSSRCDNAYYQKIKKQFQTFTKPLIYTPGDNEWTDCHRANNGAYNPLERLAYDRSVFFATPGLTLGQQPKKVTSQASLGVPENVRTSYQGVEMATVHVVGSNDDLQPWTGIGKTTATPQQVAEQTKRMKAGIANIKAAFAVAKANNARAVMVMMQADMFDPTYSVTWKDASAFKPLVQTLISESNKFSGQTYVVNGDSHVFNVDHPVAAGSKWLTFYGVTGSSKLTRITVDGSGNNTDWLRFSVNSGTGPVLSWERVPYKKVA